MEAERWKQIDELFDAALDLPEAEREAFLSARCDGDDQLKNKLLKLLEATTTVGFMERSAMGIAARNLAGEQETVLERITVGRKFGSYSVVRQIGAGGMGEIYLAADEKLNRQVALKILPAEYVSSDERIKRFQMEARAISALNHPNIVTIHDVGNDGGINFIATEYVEGKTLREIIGEKPPLTEILNIFLQVCDALAAAHDAGIVHRDIKPENIMLRPDGYVKILDFGLAKLSDLERTPSDNFTHTAKGVIVGTPAYMSPAQVTDGAVDHRTDLWSVGVCMYELLTGFNPYKKASRRETFQSILRDEPPLASTINPEGFGELDRILYKALEKDADVTYQTAADLRADLKRIRREIDSSSGRRMTLTQRSKAAQARRYLLPAAVLLFITSAALWYFFLRDSGSEAIDWSQANKIQLTNLAGTEMFPTLAPDGKSFVYTAKSARGDEDLFLQRINDKRARSITEESRADDTQAAFSPDGERLAFRSERDGAPGIYIMSATGENVRRVADFGFHPAWSPDGRELVVSTYGKLLPSSRNGQASELWIITVETGEKRLLSEADAMQPAWSPDGKYIAYWFFPPNVGRRDVGIVPVGGGEPLVITRDGTTNWNPVWSPDGRFLYFASDRGGNMSFWRVRFENGNIYGEPEAVVTPAKYSRHLAFSKDGRRMVFVSTNNRTNLQAAEFDPDAEKIIGEPFWVTTGDRQISRPELSPDGRRFLFHLLRSTQDDLVIVDRDGSNQFDLTNDAAFDRYPRWSPDGRRIVFASDRSGVYEIWTIDADGTNLKQITFHNTEGTSFPVWSPDGKRIIYRCQPRNCIIEADKSWAEQSPQVLPDFDPTDRRRFLAWDWSPDGSRLVGNINGGKREIGFYSFTENRYESIVRVDNAPMWLPDSRRFIYGMENKVFIADVGTKRAREIAGIRPTDNIQSVGISSDGGLIYYTVTSNESDIWLLDSSEQFK